MSIPTVDEPVQPFGATVDLVQALIPTGRLLNGDENTGREGVTKAQTRAWLVELTGEVQLRLSHWTRLADDQRKTAFRTAARDAVVNGVASYVEAARYPDRLSKADNSYSTVLWERYLTRLQWLSEQLDEWIDNQDHASGGSAAGWRFPPPAIPDRVGF